MIANGWPVRLAPAAARILGRHDGAGQVFSSLGPTITICWKPDDTSEFQQVAIDERNLVCAGCGLPVAPHGDEDFCKGAASGRSRNCRGAVVVDGGTP